MKLKSKLTILGGGALLGTCAIATPLAIASCSCSNAAAHLTLNSYDIQNYLDKHTKKNNSSIYLNDDDGNGDARNFLNSSVKGQNLLNGVLYYYMLCWCGYAKDSGEEFSVRATKDSCKLILDENYNVNDVNASANLNIFLASKTSFELSIKKSKLIIDISYGNGSFCKPDLLDKISLTKEHHEFDLLTNMLIGNRSDSKSNTGEDNDRNWTGKGVYYATKDDEYINYAQKWAWDRLNFVFNYNVNDNIISTNNFAMSFMSKVYETYSEFNMINDRCGEQRAKEIRFVLPLLSHDFPNIYVHNMINGHDPGEAADSGYDYN